MCQKASETNTKQNVNRIRNENQSIIVEFTIQSKTIVIDAMKLYDSSNIKVVTMIARSKCNSNQNKSKTNNKQYRNKCN